MYTYMIKTWTGKLIYVEATDQDSALKAAGLTMLDVKRMMPTEYLSKREDERAKEQDRKNREQIQRERDRKLAEKYGLDRSLKKAVAR